jgi:membrane protease YdiL (CAAX protease family)
MPLPRGIDWRLTLILLTAGLVGLASIIPMLLEWWPRLMGPEQEAELRELPLPIPLIFALGAAQNGLILGAAIVGGLALGKRVGLGAPELEAWRAGAIRPGLGRRLAAAAVIGLITGLVLIAVDALVLLPRTGVDLALWTADIPLWKRLLAGLFYGGIVEELLVRLFLVTALVWALGKVWRTSEGRPAPGAVWTAIVMATLLFALGHLPMASRLGDLTPWLVVRVLVLNGIAGMVYGWLYTRRGLEAAMAAHAATHIPLQVLAGVAASVARSVG